MLDKARSGKLGISEGKLEQHIKSRQATPLDYLGHAPQPAPPKVLFDISPLKLQEVEEVIKKARLASAPGLMGSHISSTRSIAEANENSLEETASPSRLATIHQSVLES